MKLAARVVANVVLLLGTGAIGAPAPADQPAPPLLFHTPLHQSPVRLGPLDLLQICGDRLRADTVVVYDRVLDLARLPAEPPPTALRETNAEHGKLRVVSAQGVPRSVVVEAPAVLTGGRLYALWAGSPQLGWSAPVPVNDPRPAWVSPGRARPGDTVRVIGRNLDPFPAATGQTRVRLRGPEARILVAANDRKPDTAVEAYAATVKLPANLKPGEYTVDVSRTGGNYVAASAGALTVRAALAPPKRFDATAYGAVAGDGGDDTRALVEAIAAAEPVGGQVVLPAGEFHATGIELLPGVGLAGAGAERTKLIDIAPDKFFHQGFGMANMHAIVLACGRNTIADLAFDDPLGPERRRTRQTQSSGISLGTYPRPLTDPAEDITVTRCAFSGFNSGICGFWSRQPVRHSAIVGNEFRCSYGIMAARRWTHMVIAENVYRPLAEPHWTYPSEFAGGEFVEFRGNLADGSSGKGWRNGYFWNLNYALRFALVHGNRATQTGDQETGYGEGIAFDANGNRTVFVGSPVAAGAADVTLTAGWTKADEYTGYWVRVCDGRGLGQSRRVAGHTAGEQNVVRIEPAWDVPPDKASTVAVSKVYANVWVVDNVIDNRARKSKKQQGVLLLHGGATDSVFESNDQYDCSGIGLNTVCIGRDHEFSYFCEARDNLLDGENDPPAGQGGIFLWYSANKDLPAPVLGYGAVIAGNRLRASDYYNIGGISSVAAWHRPSTTCWLEPLVFGNRLAEMPTAIAFTDPHTANAVVARNTCEAGVRPLTDRGKDTVVVQP